MYLKKLKTTRLCIARWISMRNVPYEIGFCMWPFGGSYCVCSVKPWLMWCSNPPSCILLRCMRLNKT